MLLVISPSKTQNFDCRPHGQHTIPVLLEERRRLVDQLKPMGVQQIAALMKISDRLAKLNWQRYQDFKVPFDFQNAKQALLAFRGDVYNQIATNTYHEADFTFAQQHLRIISGLYGILKPLDLIQPYRLEMGTRLPTDRGTTMYDFWGPRVTEALNRDFGKTPDAVLVNLASQEYAKVLRPDTLVARILNITFKEKKKGAYKVIGIHAKRARGLMTNFVIQNRLTIPEDLQTFDHAGYRFNRRLSGAAEWVFCR
jgi:hypothetical protein